MKHQKSINNFISGYLLHLQINKPTIHMSVSFIINLQPQLQQPLRSSISSAAASLDPDMVPNEAAHHSSSSSLPSRVDQHQYQEWISDLYYLASLPECYATLLKFIKLASEIKQVCNRHKRPSAAPSTATSASRVQAPSTATTTTATSTNSGVSKRRSHRRTKSVLDRLGPRPSPSLSP